MPAIGAKTVQQEEPSNIMFEADNVATVTFELVGVPKIVCKVPNAIARSQARKWARKHKAEQTNGE